MYRGLNACFAVLLHLIGAVAFGASVSTGQLENMESSAARAARRGDIAFRRADFDDAEASYHLALSADSANARALWGLGRIAQVNFGRGSARDYFAAAFRLDPRDPQIIQSYASVVPDPDARSILWKNYLAVAGEDRESALIQLQLRRQLGSRETEALASPYQPYTLSMTPYYPASARPAGMLLRVSINGGKPLRLVFDTGAGGIVLRARAAEKLGVEYLGDSVIRGLGAGEPAKARLGLAKSLQVDDLRMWNCLIEVSDRLPAGDADGVIGASLFQRFLIRFNPGERILELLPFPDGETARTWHGHDREVAPDSERFTRAFQVGHLLLVRARVNRGRFGYFVIDTGAAFSALASDLALPVVLTSRSTPIYGLSGRVPGATRINPVQLDFTRAPMLDLDVITLDLREMSRQEGVEISGLIGYSALNRGILTINYRDGLIDFTRR